jgi:hypothetical protein
MSNCKYSGETNPEGLIWCTKKNIYVSGQEKDSCADFVPK